MELREFFALVGGDYNEIISRLMNERIIYKFVLKFKDDPSFDLLIKSFSQNDTEAAFRAAHTMKGVCSNLGFGTLYAYSSELTECLRDINNTNLQDNTANMEKIKTEYNKIIDLINKL